MSPTSESRTLQIAEGASRVKAGVRATARETILRRVMGVADAVYTDAEVTQEGVKDKADVETTVTEVVQGNVHP